MKNQWTLTKRGRRVMYAAMLLIALALWAWLNWALQPPECRIIIGALPKQCILA